MNNRLLRCAAAALVALPAVSITPALASSHREALAVLNEPCADNTDTYAWVSPGAHNKLYLVANFNPLHEPGQGNQGLRACNGYRYEFHIGLGTSLEDRYVYRIEFTNSAPTDAVPSASDAPLGGNELLWQITGGTETAKVTRINSSTGVATVLGDGLDVAPNNHGPQTDRLAFGLGPFAGYDSGDATSREVGLYDDAFIRDNYIHDLSNGGRFFSGQRDDPYYLDEKGIFDLVNLCDDGLFGIPGARDTPCEDVFTGFNVFSVALELPIQDLFPNGIPHNGVLQANSTDSLVRVWFNISRREREVVDRNNVVTGYRYEGPWRQVGRNALPLFNAGIVGTARQTKYLRSSPLRDVTNFGADILYPVLVRDAELLGIYAALGINPNTAGLKGPRTDIINAINLGRPIPVADGFTGDVITLDAAIDSQFPNGRVLGSGSSTPSNRAQVDVSDVLISLIVAGNPAAGAGDGVNGNDKVYLTEFPFAALPHQGLNEGHGGTNNLP
jgi:hypothetical protein